MTAVRIMAHITIASLLFLAASAVTRACAEPEYSDWSDAGIE